MSSETSNNARRKRRAGPPPAGRPKPGGAPRARESARAAAGDTPRVAPAPGLQPVHLLILGTVAAASAAALFAHGTRPANIVFVVLSVLAVGIVAVAAYWTLWPLASDAGSTQPEMVGGRTRAALEREKTIVLRAIKELEFDRAMGKVSEADCDEMIGRLRGRAVRLIRQLDAGSAGYRELIDRELNARLGTTGGASRPVNGRGAELPQDAIASRVQAGATDGDALQASAMSAADAAGSVTGGLTPSAVTPNGCLACGAANDADARFCKACGTKLGAPA